MLDTRFFTTKDPQVKQMGGFTLHPDWWSRPYEYAWAVQFLEEGDEVLDAGCGIPHPFKFYAAERVNQLVGIDVDPKIQDPTALLDEVNLYFGEQAVDYAKDSKAELVLGNMEELVETFGENSFDKVFCLSVLEHLPEARRRRIFHQFQQVLRPGGLLILTLDHPTITMDTLILETQYTQLYFKGEIEYKLPNDAILSPVGGLRCFRAVLAKDGKTEEPKALIPDRETKVAGPTENKPSPVFSKKRKLR